MNDTHPTPEEFKELDAEEKNSAYTRLFDTWKVKGKTIRVLKDAKKSNHDARRSGGFKRHDKTRNERNLFIQTFWDFCHKHNSKKPTYREVFQVLIDSRAKRNRGMNDDELARRKQSEIKELTAKRWRTYCGKAWDSRTSWNDETTSFRDFKMAFTKAQKNKVSSLG